MAINDHSSQLFLKMGKQSNGGEWSANLKSGGGGAKHAQGFKRMKFYIHDGRLLEVGSFFLDDLEL